MTAGCTVKPAEFPTADRMLVQPVGVEQGTPVGRSRLAYDQRALAQSQMPCMAFHKTVRASDVSMLFNARIAYGAYL